jgi:hypothetical protein
MRDPFGSAGESQLRGGHGKLFPTMIEGRGTSDAPLVSLPYPALLPEEHGASD